MLLPFKFDFKKPDYQQVFDWRRERLNNIRLAQSKDNSTLPLLKLYYKHHPAEFINDWGMTYDPRLLAQGMPAVIPFILMDYQIDLIETVMECWKNKEPLLVDKSRDMGATTTILELFGTLQIFYEGFSAGVGSRKLEYVDKKKDLKALLPKCRFFLEHLPSEFVTDYNERTDAPFQIVRFPATNSYIAGEAGDNIGRGARFSMYLVDESASLERPNLVEESLASTTECRIDVSTPRGRSNIFAQKRFSGNIKIFSMHWTRDHRKDRAWYNRVCQSLNHNKVLIAQELDLDYSASVEGILIEAAWVNAAIDAHLKLNIEPTGIRIMGADIADEGKDKNAFCIGRGGLIEQLKLLSGKGSDLFETTEKICDYADEYNVLKVKFDSDGLGAGIRGDARKVNERRKANGLRKIEFIPYRGSGAIIDPKKEVFPPSNLSSKDAFPGRLNEDYFLNSKAQEWFRVKMRFQETYHAVVENKPFNPDNIISLSSKMENLEQLKLELSQPIMIANQQDKHLIDKTPSGMPSPNCADALMIYNAHILTKPKSIFDVPLR